MQTQLKHPTQYKSEDEFVEAVQQERMTACHCPNGCNSLLDVERIGASGLVLECNKCGFIKFTNDYITPDMGQVGSA